MNIGEILFLKVKNTTLNTAVLELENGEEIFMYKNEWRGEIFSGEKYQVIIFKDELNNKILASEKIDKHLNAEVKDNEFEVNDEVDGYIYDFTEIGAKVAINKTHRGVLFQNEITRDLKVGDSLKLYINNIRKEDKKIDLSLKRKGYRDYINSSTTQILEVLERVKTEMPFTDKSSPEDIRKTFQMSKKVFKESIGKLYKLRKIEITDSGIKLIKAVEK